jgi:hypothetical protein
MVRCGWKKKYLDLKINLVDIRNIHTFDLKPKNYIICQTTLFK